MKKENQLELFFDYTEDLEKVPYRSYLNFDKVKNMKAFDGVEGTTVLPVWNKYRQMKFDGSTTIESHQDVAYMMRALESKGTEHAFAVHINEKKEPFIQFLSTGSKNGTSVEADLVLAGSKIHESKEIYLVHNHPSGNLKPSDADLIITDRIKKAFSELDIDIYHVILNTYKSAYTVINDLVDYDEFSRDEMKDKAIPYESYSYDEMKVLREPIGTVVSSKSVAEIIQQYRFSALPKHGILALSIANGAVANFFVDEFDLKTITDIVANIPTVKNVIAYGNTDKKEEMKELEILLKGLGLKLLDYVQVNSNANGVKNAYVSYSDEGVLGEIQAKYGTNEIKESALMKKKEFPWEGGLEQKEKTGRGI